jgi:hypothetical protein
MLDVAHAPKPRTRDPRPGALREFGKDWRRWSRGERVAALAIVTVSLIGLPAALALNGL